jgi:PhzF family phenazine biosynthesis protein
MQPQSLSAFSRGTQGGNAAGVVIGDVLPDPATMQAIAKSLGHSETAFAAPLGKSWQVRYFAPDAEVAFCGHATIALGAAMGAKFGEGIYQLSLSESEISVAASKTPDGWVASLQSPRTWSKPLPDDLAQRLLSLFNLSQADLDDRLPPTLGFAGVRHAIFALRSRSRLAQMAYDFDAMRAVMAAADLTTVSLLFIASKTEFVARNAFAIGGVVEDAATGAAAAALGGALVDQGWSGLRGGGAFTILQGDDMGSPSTLQVEVTGTPGDSVRVSGSVYII